ncbi:hypothetical protein HYR54_10900 [Candidatus Acetothermia bacterium]|nr:hypothetical protein [Candidatus Acetothermia bacterium]
MNDVRRELYAVAEAQKRTENNITKLVRAQARSEKRLDGVAVALQKLAKAQTRTEEAVDKLAARVDELTEAQTRTEKQLERFERATEKRFESVEKHIEQLTKVQSEMKDDLGWVKGESLEHRYRERTPAYFAQIIRRAHVVDGDELVALLEDAVDRGQITADERNELLLTDVIVRGKRRDEESDVYVVVEVSWIVDGHDVERAARRAKLLSQVSVLSIPVVAGTDITQKAMEMARSLSVWYVIDGQTTPP